MPIATPPKPKEVGKNFRGTETEVGCARQLSERLCVRKLSFVREVDTRTRELSERVCVRKLDTCTGELWEVVCERGRYVYERPLWEGAC